MASTLESFIKNYQHYQTSGHVHVYDHVEKNGQRYPLVSVSYGNKNAPALMIVGGVHGLERIGAQLALSLLDSFHHRLQWDGILPTLLEKIQLVFIPLANPVGYFETTRGNGSGVDIARNAPIETEEPAPFLLGGHHYSNKLPWYRGLSVQRETQFLMDTAQNLLSRTDCLISIDIHSGFGFRDQLWFPFAGSRKPFAQLNQMYLLFELFETTNPYHIYKIEPQSKNYLTHGDLWDYSFFNFMKAGQTFLPLTLEMGSWIWVKKNPLQIFSKTGLFNPIKEHRLKRTFRRHRPLFDFLLHALYSNHSWTKSDLTLAEQIHKKAMEKYY